MGGVHNSPPAGIENLVKANRPIESPPNCHYSMAVGVCQFMKGGRDVEHLALKGSVQ